VIHWPLISDLTELADVWLGGTKPYISATYERLWLEMNLPHLQCVLYSECCGHEYLQDTFCLARAEFMFVVPYINALLFLCV